jgi:hypothetical protein
VNDEVVEQDLDCEFHSVRKKTATSPVIFVYRVKVIPNRLEL